MRDWAAILGLPLWAWLFVIPSIIALACAARPEPMRKILAPTWRILDKIYLASGIIAACFMVLILLTIIGQMVARWSSVTFQGSTEFAGYAMAATSFFAFAHALNRGAHIRVSIFLNLNNFTRLWLDAFAMWIAALTATYFARYAVKTNIFSEMLNDRTQGQDQVPEWVLSAVTMLGTWPWQWGELWANTGDKWVYTPVWLPQLPMSIGTILLAIALWDNLYRLMIDRKSHIVSEALV